MKENKKLNRTTVTKRNIKNITDLLRSQAGGDKFKSYARKPIRVHHQIVLERASINVAKGLLCVSRLRVGETGVTLNNFANSVVYFMCDLITTFYAHGQLEESIKSDMLQQTFVKLHLSVAATACRIICERLNKDLPQATLNKINSLKPIDTILSTFGASLYSAVTLLFNMAEEITRKEEANLTQALAADVCSKLPSQPSKWLYAVAEAGRDGGPLLDGQIAPASLSPREAIDFAIEEFADTADLVKGIENGDYVLIAVGVVPVKINLTMTLEFPEADNEGE